MKHAPSWIYGITAVIFLAVAAINALIIAADGTTTLRIIATIAFFIGGLLQLFAFIRGRKLRP